MSTESEITATTRTIKASEFKAKCLKLMDEVAASGEEIVITKNGKPVAKLTPWKPTGQGKCPAMIGPSLPLVSTRESMKSSATWTTPFLTWTGTPRQPSGGNTCLDTARYTSSLSGSGLWRPPH